MAGGDDRSCEQIDHSSSELYWIRRRASIAPSLERSWPRHTTQRSAAMKKKSKGFSADRTAGGGRRSIGILSAFAIPAYNDYITRGKIAEATSGPVRRPHQDGAVFPGQPHLYRRADARVDDPFSTIPSPSLPRLTTTTYTLDRDRHRRNARFQCLHHRSSQHQSDHCASSAWQPTGGIPADLLGHQEKIVLMTSSPRSKSAGFTLIELMIARRGPGRPGDRGPAQLHEIAAQLRRFASRPNRSQTACSARARRRWRATRGFSSSGAERGPR